MTARRDFLKGAAASGIFFCGCALLRAAHAQSSTARALPVMVNGKRVKTIDMEVLSINPFWYRKERDTAAAIVKVQNEKLAELCASRPDRFAAFASLALQYPDLAVEQLEHAVKKDRTGTWDISRLAVRRCVRGTVRIGKARS